MKRNWGSAWNSIHRVSLCPVVLEFLEFLELFCAFFGTGSVLEKIHFFRLALELFTNSDTYPYEFFKFSSSKLWLSLELTVATMDFHQQNTNLPKFGMKYKLKLATNLTLVIGPKIGSQSLLKNITLSVVTSCLT